MSNNSQKIKDIKLREKKPKPKIAMNKHGLLEEISDAFDGSDSDSDQDRSLLLNRHHRYDVTDDMIKAAHFVQILSSGRIRPY